MQRGSRWDQYYMPAGSDPEHRAASLGGSPGPCPAVQSSAANTALNGSRTGAEQPLAPGRRMQCKDGQLSMELNRLLLFTAFLLHIKLSRMSPARLVCDSRLIQTYINEAKDMEKRMSQCQELPSLPQPLPLPMVDFSLREWKTKTHETKRQEILWDLESLVDAALAAQAQVRQECAAALLGQLYKKANSFLLLLPTFSWQISTRQPDHASRTVLQSHPSRIFLVYRQLVQGKLHFLFHDLAKDYCREGSQGGTRAPRSPMSPAASRGQ
uniref:Thrombopoietin n=1 Tax=Pelusios castaneus TaxID=367368 RepID=A0A8C8VFU6_9SAUR